MPTRAERPPRPPLYHFQEQCIEGLLAGKHFVIIGTGTGKSAVQMIWAERVLEEHPDYKLLVITTASKVSSGDYYKELELWTDLPSEQMEVISWHKLAKWEKTHTKSDKEYYVYVFDEVAKGNSYSSQMSKAFMKLTSQSSLWAGFTATPGDVWLKFLPYFVATGKVKNKTAFLRDFAVLQTYKGYPEIVRYVNTNILQSWWDEISIRPSTKQLYEELPPETHEVVYFSTPKLYNEVKRTRIWEDKFLDSTMSLVARLRQLCFGKEKKQWLSDFLEGLGENAVLFVNYIEEEEEIQKIADKLHIKVWRIDGKHHDRPTKETIGKTDIVVANYGAGAEGLNLQFIAYWVGVSYNWSYTTMTQARGRVKRIGQTHDNIFFYYLECKGTIETDIRKCLKNKSDFSEKTWAEQEGLDG